MSLFPTDWLLPKPYSMPCRLPQLHSFRQADQLACYRTDAEADNKAPVLATCFYKAMLPPSPIVIVPPLPMPPQT
jgi:hypothetical protein